MRPIKLYEDRSLREKFRVFRDREHAGELLANFLEENLETRDNLLTLGIPRGGIPVACVVARKLGTDLDLVIVRKIPIHWDPEAGFGAVTPDGEVLFNRDYVEYLGLRDDEVQVLVNDVLREIRRREKIFRGDKEEISIEGKNVTIIDDGIATGYTMYAAIKYVKRMGANKVFVATPTASKGAIKFLLPNVDALYCLNIRSEIPFFAVADAYENWRDLTDEDVIYFLKKYGFY